MYNLYDKDTHLVSLQCNGHIVTPDITTKSNKYLFFIGDDQTVSNDHVLVIENLLKNAYWFIDCDYAFKNATFGSNFVIVKQHIFIQPVYSPVFLWFRTGFYRVSLFGQNGVVFAQHINIQLMTLHVFDLVFSDTIGKALQYEPHRVNTRMHRTSIYESHMRISGQLNEHEKSLLKELHYEWNDRYNAYIR